MRTERKIVHRLRPMRLTPDQQTYCTYGEDVAAFEKEFYDHFPPVVQRAMQDAPYNFCPWCIYHMAKRLHSPPRAEDCLAVIAAYVEQIATKNQRHVAAWVGAIQQAAPPARRAS
jgi:hypothetical protein